MLKKPIHRGCLACLSVLAAALMAAGCDDEGTGPEIVTMFAQTDRFGIPAINTVFIPTDQKQTFNESVPASDRANFRDEALATLAAFGITGATAEGIADFVLPDTQPFDTSTATSFPNGRALSDDVITVELMLIFDGNAALNDDHVDGNDKAFLAAFPYLASPHE